MDLDRRVRLEVWRLTWVNPVTGAEKPLVGRRDGRQVIQEGVDAEGPANTLGLRRAAGKPPHGGAMIIRVWRGRSSVPRADEYQAFLRKMAYPDYGEVRGQSRLDPSSSVCVRGG